MAAKKRPDEDIACVTDESVEQLRRISKLLALLAVKAESQEDKIRTLTSAGFTTSEVADLIGTTANTVAVTKSISKKKSKKKLARKRAKATK